MVMSASVLTKTRIPIAPSFHPSVISLSCSPASFMYTDHILRPESSWAIMEIIRTYGDHCLLTYLHRKPGRPEEAGIVRCVECMSPPSPSELGPDDIRG